MGKDLLKYVRNDDIDKAQKLLGLPNKVRSTSSWSVGKKQSEILRQERDQLLDVQHREHVDHLDVNCREEGTGYTPLILAVLSGNHDMAKMLIHFGAYVNATDYKGNTALHVAAFHNRSDMIDLLLQCDAELDVANQDGNTPFHVVCLSTAVNRFAVLKLLKAGPDIWMVNKDGATPFDLAAQFGRTETVALLMDHDPHLRQTASTASTAFLEACIRGHRDIVRLMLEYGIDPNIIDEKLQSGGLHEACRYLRLDVAKLLVSYGADDNLKNPKGETPRDILANYPLQRQEAYFKIFEDWKLKPKLKPGLIDNKSNTSGALPLLILNPAWTKNHPAYCSGWIGSNNHMNLLDENPSTLWVAPSAKNAWVVFDFGHVCTLTGVRITGWDSEQMPKKCQLQAGDSIAGPWRCVRVFTCLRKGPTHSSIPGEVQDFYGFRETSQFWRLLVKDNYGHANTAFHAINFYGADSAVLQFFRQLDLEQHVAAFLRKGYTVREQMMHISEADISEIIVCDEDQSKLLTAVQQEKHTVTGVKRQSEIDAMFADLEAMLKV